MRDYIETLFALHSLSNYRNMLLIEHQNDTYYKDACDYPF